MERIIENKRKEVSIRKNSVNLLTEKSISNFYSTFRRYNEKSKKNCC